MPISKSLLDILCCPVSKVPVHMLPQTELEKLNNSIKQGDVLYVDGSPVENPLEEALITDDSKVIYRIDEQIPVMLPEKGIGTTQL
ncbi:MAG: Trm112 family protein [bacterium]